MTFEIEVAGRLRRTVRHRLAELVGGAAVAERAGHLVVSAGDQAAMIGILHHLNDLGLDVDRIERTSEVAGHSRPVSRSAMRQRPFSGSATWSPGRPVL